MRNKKIVFGRWYASSSGKTLLAAAVLCIMMQFQASARPKDGTDMAAYTVWFTDEEDTSAWIFAPQAGTVESGTLLTIPFPEKIIGSDGYIWSAAEESPKRVEVFAPGNEKFYVYYRREEKLPKLPEEIDEKRLEHWLQRAWEADCHITGNDPLKEPEYNLLSENKKQNDSRLTNLVTIVRNLQAESRDWHYVYLIGKNYVPQTVILGNWQDVEYSAVKEETFTVKGIPFTVLRVGLRKRWSGMTCPHQWEKRTETLPTCLKFGVRNYVCSLCESEEAVLLPPGEHRDTDGDSLCDICAERVFLQKKGDVISAVLKTGMGELPLTFTCLDENYRGTGKMMYLADQVLDREVTGLCFAKGEGSNYMDSSLRRYFTYGYSNDISLASALYSEIQTDGREDSAFLFTEEEYEAYSHDQNYRPASAAYFLKTPEDGEKIKVANPDGTVKSVPAEGYTGAGVRPFILLDQPDAHSAPENHYWKEGELQVRNIEGEDLFFRCIDEDYSDMQENHRRMALFLCDTVIRSDATFRFGNEDFRSGSGKTERLSFGNDNNYKNSYVRKWLINAADSDNLQPVSIGVTAAYAGATLERMKEEMNTDNLRKHPIGFQLMQDRMFCLSVEEAFRYRNRLWKFSGSQSDNEESQVTSRSTGYYLRTPVYQTDSSGEFCYSDEIYSVDLERGNIRPVKTDSEETGIRPAFVMEQGE